MTTTSGRVRTAVVPAAGQGTRFLPASKAIPKEMVPLVDRPAVQYVLEEAAAAGLSDALLVTARGKDAMEDHFDRAPELEASLEGKESKAALLEEVRHAADIIRVHSVRQGEARGLGHAVLQAAEHVGDAPCAVLLGDDVIHPDETLLARMLEVQAERGGCVVALLDVPADQVDKYGIATVEATDADDVVRVRAVVEKPDVGDAPSTLAVIGRYVIAPELFDVLRETPPGKGDEIQLTDALQQVADREGDGGPLWGVVFTGRRFDTGDKQGWLRATVELACERADLGPDLKPWLRDFVAGLDG